MIDIFLKLKLKLNPTLWISRKINRRFNILWLDASTNQGLGCAVNHKLMLPFGSIRKITSPVRDCVDRLHSRGGSRKD
jgi:hypothetical protein